MNGRQVVEQVVFCVDKTLNVRFARIKSNTAAAIYFALIVSGTLLQQFIECNSAITSSLENQAPCGQEIYYPPIEYQSEKHLPIRRRQA